jgi:hypothetical protein
MVFEHDLHHRICNGAASHKLHQRHVTTAAGAAGPRQFHVAHGIVMTQRASVSISLHCFELQCGYVPPRNYIRTTMQFVAIISTLVTLPPSHRMYRLFTAHST